MAAFQVALPNNDNPVTEPAQFLGAAPITVHISESLRPPESRIALGQAVASRATVPEASVHENADLRGRECEVGPTRQRKMTPPAAHAGMPKRGSHCDLRGAVAPSSDSRHECRSFVRRKMVHMERLSRPRSGANWAEAAARAHRSGVAFARLRRHKDTRGAAAQYVQQTDFTIDSRHRLCLTSGPHNGKSV